ncbi:MAG: CoA pyrophosphatase [Pseudomonadota bacterium]
MSVSQLQLLETRLEKYKPGKKWLRPFMKRSAVAMILQLREQELHILMIKRAEREGDPWSGHMAFPGGRMDKSDANGFQVAVRETDEEIGVRLGSADPCIGRLSDLKARPGRAPLGLVVSPFVFRLERDVRFTPNYEVDEVVWVPMPFLLDENNREKFDWRYKGVNVPVPCYWYEGRCIWGLSLMMLSELMTLMPGRNPRRGRGGSRFA